MTSSPKRVVLAYSGGLDTSVILRWLIERCGCEVVAFCADLGQGEELVPIREKALRTGASAVHVVDLRQEFVRDFIFPMLRANAVYEGSYLLGTSIARPLIARAQVDVARHERADAVAHGATGKGNDQVRFELTYAALAPELRVIAPWRARRRPRGPRRESLRGNEVARRLRDARRHHPARGQTGGGVAHARPRGPAPARLARPALRRDDLLRLLVFTGAARAPGVHGRGR